MHKTGFQIRAWFKKGSGTVAGTARRVLRTTVPDPFLNHKVIAWGLLVVTTIAVLPTASAQPASIGFDGASWIWSSMPVGGNLGSLGAGIGYFRSKVTVPESPAIDSAEVIVTCDNLFVLYLNGMSVGESEANNAAWQRPKRFDVTHMLVPGETVLAIEAVNTLPGPAGLVVKFVARLNDGQEIVSASGPNWKSSPTAAANWQQSDFDDGNWQPAAVVGRFGDRPWGKPKVPGTAQSGGLPIGAVHKAAAEVLKQAAAQPHAAPIVLSDPPDDFDWPESIVFVGDDCSLYRPTGRTGSATDSLTVTIFNPRKARTFPEHDLPAPMKVGRKLYRLSPTPGGAVPQLLLDAGRGALGSPGVSFDGRSVFVSMAYDGEPFFRIYRVPADGGSPQRLTEGPFHDVDPAELPDGRIVFTSTRIGCFEEYHSPPSRALFVMNADGSNIRTLTNTIIFDNEPEVLADGRIVFIRSDNFFDRGKVETLLHAVHTDGSEGYTEFGLDNGPEYGNRLRANLCGSPAPMPDGRLAFLSGPGITIGRLGYPSSELAHYSMEAGDVAAMPDGRLLCTIALRIPVEVTVQGVTRTTQELSYERIGVLDPDSDPPAVSIVYESTEGALHSPVFLGPRRRPPTLAEKIDQRKIDDPRATGVLFCQNARFTKQTTAGWSHVRAIRVLAGKGLTTRSSHSYIVHAGNETTELGTVPLAPDGSFAIEVPADTPIALQAVDAEGRSELNEMSWIYVRPGERRGCVGCHHSRQSTPLDMGPMPMALGTRPAKLLGQGQPHHFRGNNAAVTGMMELQFDRYREVAGINRHADTGDPAATVADEVAALVSLLRDDDSSKRISACGRLSIFRDQAAADALAECLTDRSREVRIAAAMSLAACGTRASIAPLLETLADADPLVAQAAAVALENLTGHAEPFDPFVDAEARNRQAEIWRGWFTETSWDQIEQDLVRRLSAGDRDVARRAAVALGHTGDRLARAGLAGYVAEHREVNPFPDWRAGKQHRGDRAQFNSLAPVNPRSLQAAVRSLGYLKSAESVPMLAETIAANDDPETGNLFLAEAAAEALGRIGTPAAETALIGAFAALGDYPDYTLWYGDHPALMSCHASPVHYFIIEALDRLGSTRAAGIVPHLIRSVPIDPDRALLLSSDDYETLTGRVIRRQGFEAAVTETCLSLLGDPDAQRDEEIAEAVSTTIRCWAGHPGPENRAAQILSAVVCDRSYEPRIVAAFGRYRALPMDIPRVFDTGIPQVQTLPIKNWVCFFLARSLGNLAALDGVVGAGSQDERLSTDVLLAALADSAPEAAGGHPDPLGPGVLFLHNDLTPCWRAAVAWALGQIGDRRAVPVLLAVVENLANAPDTRHAAAEALGRIADPSSTDAIQALASGYPEVSTRRALLRASVE